MSASANVPGMSKLAWQMRCGALAALLVSAQVARTGDAAAQNGAAERASPEATHQVMPEADRATLQSDLAWAGFYDGPINGDVGTASLDAIKAFQKSIDAAQTGVLDPAERRRLADAARAKNGFLGWTILTDPVTGIRLGLPKKLAPQETRTGTGTRWSSAQGQIRIETWRVREAGLTAASLAARERNHTPKRQIAHSTVRDDQFVLDGLQGLKRFYVRGELRNGEARGITVLYDQATEGVMEPVVAVMARAFSPFPGGVAAGMRAPRPKVEYATGIVAGDGRMILTDADATGGCRTLNVAGLGPAERTAQDAQDGIALLRVYGEARGVPFDNRIAPPAQTFIATGIAAPAQQNGGGAISRIELRAETKDGAIMLIPSPASGFSGAAVSGAGGGFVGMVSLRDINADGQAPQTRAVLIPASNVRELLARADAPPDGSPNGDSRIEESIVRVICVRQ